MAIADSGLSKLLDFQNGSATLKNGDDLKGVDLSFIKKLEARKTPVSSSLYVETHDTVRALELLGRHLGMFTRPLSGDTAKNKTAVREVLQGYLDGIDSTEH